MQISFLILDLLSEPITDPRYRRCSGWHCHRQNSSSLFPISILQRSVFWVFITCWFSHVSLPDTPPESHRKLLSFPPADVRRHRQAVANSFSVCSKLELTTQSLALSFSPSLPLISVGSCGIIRQFQSSPSRFSPCCGRWPAYQTLTNTRSHKLTQMNAGA